MEPSPRKNSSVKELPKFNNRRSMARDFHYSSDNILKTAEISPFMSMEYIVQSQKEERKSNELLNSLDKLSLEKLEKYSSRSSTQVYQNQVEITSPNSADVYEAEMQRIFRLQEVLKKVELIRGEPLPNFRIKLNNMMVDLEVQLIDAGQ